MNDMTNTVPLPGASLPYRPSLRISGRDWLMIIAAFMLSRVALYGMGYFGVQLYGSPTSARCRPIVNSTASGSSASSRTATISTPAG